MMKTMLAILAVACVVGAGIAAHNHYKIDISKSMANTFQTGKVVTTPAVTEPVKTWDRVPQK